MKPDSDKKPLCFVIGPFGDDHSKERVWSDCLLENIIKLAVGDHYDVLRTIDRPEAGNITDRIHRDIDQAQMVIADISDNNPNVFYEIGLRHGRRLPFVMVRRADTETKIPFNLSTYETIKIDALYNERTNQYWIGAPATVIAGLRAQVALAAKAQRIPRFLEEGLYRVEVFDWVTTYASTIAKDWLKMQEPPIRQMIEEYEHGVAKAPPEQNEQVYLAEYISLKLAASKVWEGDIVYFLNDVTKELAVGYATYQFPTGTMVIVLSGKVTHEGNPEITFDQPERAVSVGDLQVTLPRYKFTVKFKGDDETGELVGTIFHPKTHTTVGTAVLTPKWGFR